MAFFIATANRKKEGVIQEKMVEHAAMWRNLSKFGNWKLRRGLRRSLCGGTCRTARRENYHFSRQIRVLCSTRGAALLLLPFCINFGWCHTLRSTLSTMAQGIF